MLEYLAYKKFKEHREKVRASVPSATSGQDSVADVIVIEGLSSQEKGKHVSQESDAINSQDEEFLESNLGVTSAFESPMTLKRRIVAVASQWSILKKGKFGGDNEDGKMASSSLIGQSRSEDDEDLPFPDDPLAPLPDEEAQRTQLEKLLNAFHMNMSSSSADARTELPVKTMAQRMNDTFRVSTFNKQTKELISEFLQILKDIQSGVPLAGKDLQAFFEKHATDLKEANDSVPSFVKTLVLKLLPFSAIPTIEELSKPGAVMGMIRAVLQVLKTRFPAFVGGSVLMVMAVAVVMLGLFYAFRRGREERESAEDPFFSHVSGSGVEALGRPGRQVEISVEGVRYVTILDEDGMRVPVPEDERGVYWDRKV